MSVGGRVMQKLSLRRVVFSYTGQKIEWDFDAAFTGASVVAVVGVSGSGKTTLFRLIGGLERPQSGEIGFEGGKRPQMSIVPQDGAVFPWLTVRENLQFPARFSSEVVEGRGEHNTSLSGILTELGLLEIQNRYPRDISGGQKQRVAVGRAISADASVVMFDEPFSSLDPMGRRNARNLIRRETLKRKWITFVASHDLLDVAYIADRCIVVSGGNKRDLTELELPPLSHGSDREAAAAVAIARKMEEAL